jgi:glucose/arabinose dehydrogenase
LKIYFFFILSLVLVLVLLTNNYDTYAEPMLKDTNLKAKLVTQGLHSPTSMAFLDENHILVLEKNSGDVLLVSNGVLQKQPVLKLNVDHTTPTCCRGLLGIAVVSDKPAHLQNVFLYYSELLDDKDSVRNRLYRYTWNGESLVNPVLILDLPATPGPNHPAGKIAIGLDGYLYTLIGDLNNEGKLQNVQDGPDPNDSSAIFKISTTDGSPAKDNPFIRLNSKMSKYYGYGVRNSFGLDIDPVTGVLWDTENGDKDFDEINLIKPGFNSGWRQLMGPLSANKVSIDDLVRFPGSRYSDPVFSFAPSLGVTDIQFFNSTKLGAKYENNVFVGDINHGNLYFFTLNKARSGFIFGQNEQNLLDSVANGGKELSEIALGTGFGGITDIKTGPDGLLYILTFDQELRGEGKIYRISHYLPAIELVRPIS